MSLMSLNIDEHNLWDTLRTAKFFREVYKQRKRKAISSEEAYYLVTYYLPYSSGVNPWDCKVRGFARTQIFT